MNLEDLIRFTMSCFLVVCMGSFVLSLNGFDTIFNAEEVSYVNSALALVVATISSVLIYLGWQWLFYCVEICNTKRSLSAVMAVGLVILGCIFGVSSAPGVVGMAKDKPQNIHVQKSFMLWEGDFEQVQLFQNSVSALIPELKMERDRYAERGKLEFQNGDQTGAPGPGAVSSGQMAIGHQLDALITHLETAHFELGEEIKSGQRILEKARISTAKLKSPKAKMENIAPYADQLRSILVSIKSHDLSGMIERVVNALPREIDSRIQWAKGADLRKRQKLVIAAIRDELDATADRINNHLETLEELKLKRVHGFERITAMKASVVYYDELFTLWTTSLIIDSFGYLVLCLLLIKTHGLSREDIHNHEVSNTKVKDIRIAKDAESFSNRMGPPLHVLERMDADHYGLKNASGDEVDKGDE